MEDNSDCKAAIAVTGGTLEVVAPSEIFGGTYTSNAAEGVKIVSYDGTTGGVFVENSTYSVDGATISLSGRGKGLAGRCTALGVKDRGVLTVKNAVVYTNGKAKSCTSAEENSVLRVYDSILISMGQPIWSGSSCCRRPGGLSAARSRNRRKQPNTLHHEQFFQLLHALQDHHGRMGRPIHRCRHGLCLFAGRRLPSHFHQKRLCRICRRRMP